MTRSRRVAAAAAVAVVIAVAVIAVAVLARRDPYGPGTSHEVTVRQSCLNVDPLVLDGRVWDPQGPTPEGWTSPATHAGRLDVVAVDEGVFTPRDPGPTIRFQRTTKQFSDMPCVLGP
ncbi:MAG: hypothetical protein U0Q07_18285 [Acidimicrobiales bacterium]